MACPDANFININHIITTFEGKTAGVDDESWLVTFPTEDASDNAKNLIMMLRGWSANSHASAKNTIKIFCL